MLENDSPEQLKLLLKEVTHRCANDHQLISSLLRLQSRTARSEEAREALQHAADRVNILAVARAATRTGGQTLESALQNVCSALNSQVEPHGLLVTMSAAAKADGLSEDDIFRITLCVNELATNAVKHAFKERQRGIVSIEISHCDEKLLIICIDDDGLPLPPASDPARGSGLGHDLVRRLMQSMNGKLVMPEPGSKRFELRVQRATSSTEY